MCYVSSGFHNAIPARAVGGVPTALEDAVNGIVWCTDDRRIEESVGTWGVGWESWKEETKTGLVTAISCVVVVGYASVKSLRICMDKESEKDVKNNGKIQHFHG